MNPKSYYKKFIFHIKSLISFRLRTQTLTFFLSGHRPAQVLCVALWSDNGNTFFSTGWEFLLSLFHPPDEVRVKAEAENGCATWEIIQLSDQRGHTRGLIIPPAALLAKEEEEEAPQLAALTCWNIVTSVWKYSRHNIMCSVFFTPTQLL